MTVFIFDAMHTHACFSHREEKNGITCRIALQIPKNELHWIVYESLSVSESVYVQIWILFIYYTNVFDGSFSLSFSLLILCLSFPSRSLSLFIVAHFPKKSQKANNRQHTHAIAKTPHSMDVKCSEGGEREGNRWNMRAVILCNENALHWCAVLFSALFRLVYMKINVFHFTQSTWSVSVFILALFLVCIFFGQRLFKVIPISSPNTENIGRVVE